MTSHETDTQQIEPGLLVSAIPVALLMFLMSLNYFIGDLAVSSTFILILVAIIAALIATFHLKISFATLETGIRASIDQAMQAILILFVVGSLISIWIMSGIVPVMIYYGLSIIHPSVFLFVSCIMCAVVALCTGSSWSTAGTIGIALIAIGSAMNVPEGMVAGAVVSGAFFGDKMSPMSDTTNLTPAMVGVDVITHIRHMMYTSGPAIIISLILFLIIGFFYQGDAVDQEQIALVQNTISENFNVSLWLLVIPLIVVLAVTQGVQALPALILGVALAMAAIPLFQYSLLEKMLDGNVTIVGIYSKLVGTAMSGFSIETGNAMIDKLFSRGGMHSMLEVNLLVIGAVCFGGIMEISGMLQKLAGTILKGVRGTGSLIGTTLATCFFINVTSASQAMAIIVPARMFRTAYQDHGLHPKNLSRACEDAGTVMAPLIPWNSSGVFLASVLGVSVLSYAPFALFCFISPIVSQFLASSNLTMTRLDDDQTSSEDLKPTEALNQS